MITRGRSGGVRARRSRRARWSVGAPSVVVAIVTMLSVMPVSARAALTVPAPQATQTTPEPSLEPTPAVEPISESIAELEPGPTTAPPAEPSAQPIPAPTAEPIPAPTAEPTPEPPAEPTADSVPEPSADPTTDATPEPTAESTDDPSVQPPTGPTTESTAPAALDPRGSVASAELPLGSYQTATGLGFPPHGLVRIVLEPVHRDLGTQAASADGEVVTRFSTTGLTAGVYTVTWTPLDGREPPLGASDGKSPPAARPSARGRRVRARSGA